MDGPGLHRARRNGESVSLSSDPTGGATSSSASAEDASLTDSEVTITLTPIFTDGPGPFEVQLHCLCGDPDCPAEESYDA